VCHYVVVMRVSVKRVKQATHLSTVVSALCIEEKNKAIRLRDIVAYGIGNFARKSYSAPMLQFACLLLEEVDSLNFGEEKGQHCNAWLLNLNQWLFIVFSKKAFIM
jgi:hypothetical protein